MGVSDVSITRLRYVNPFMRMKNKQISKSNKFEIHGQIRGQILGM